MPCYSGRNKNASFYDTCQFFCALSAAFKTNETDFSPISLFSEALARRTSIPLALYDNNFSKFRFYSAYSIEDICIKITAIYLCK